MKAEVKSILPITAHYTWGEVDIDESWNCYHWFTLDIGIKDQVGADIFFALVATPAAEHIAKTENKNSYCFVVDSFTQESVNDLLEDYVANLFGETWNDFSEQLRKVMRWEYEGFAD